jgi:hypothetical protein
MREGRFGEWNRSAPPLPTKLRHSALFAWFVYPGNVGDRASLMRALRIAELAMFDMRQEGSPPPDDLYSALRDILGPSKRLCRHGVGRQQHSREGSHFSSATCAQVQNALRAMMVEAVFCDFRRKTHRCSLPSITGFTAGLETAAIVCLGLPALMVVAQVGIHRAAHTPHVGAGVLASFCFAVASSAYSWYVMRHGALW